MKNFFRITTTIMLGLLLHSGSNAQSWLKAGNTIGSGDHKLGSIDSKPVSFITNDKTRMTIKSDGRIGIGTTSPTAFLHLFGTMQIENNTSTIYDEPLLTIRSSSNGTPTNPVIAFKVEDTLFAVMGYDNSTRDIVLSTQSAGYSPDLIINHDNGFVGLGTKTPSEVLDVIGNELLEGNLKFKTDQQSIQFANPGTSASAMMYMFTTAQSNNRMVIAHSPAFPTWGLQYVDNGDQFNFLKAGTSVMTVGLGNSTVSVYGNMGVQATAGTNTIQVGTTLGSVIGLGTAERISDGGAFEIACDGSVRPWTDNTYTCGTSSFRWSSVWAVDGTINTSDARDKTNIRDLDYGLNEIMKLRSVRFNWKDNLDDGEKLGLLAQDLQQVLPEVVRDFDWQVDEKTGARTKVSSDRLGVMYADIIPVMIKSIQEQQVQIMSKDATISDQQNQIDALRNSIEEIKSSLQACGITCFSSSQSQSQSTRNSPSEENKLFQNVPNPADGSTVIAYSLKSGTKDASIEIRNINGTAVKTYSVSGIGNITVLSVDLPAGSYQYSLIIDGAKVSTKQMVIAR